MSFNQLLEYFTIVERLFVWLVALAVIFVPLERMLALQPSTKSSGSEIACNCAYFFLSSIAPTILVALPVAAITALLVSCLPSAWFSWSGVLPRWARSALALAAAEIGAYWGHRLCHSWTFLWRFHAVHHAPEELHWLVHTRAHPFDIAFVRLCALVPLLALGLSRPTAGGAGMAAIVSAATVFWGFLVHANVRIRFGWLEWLLATPFFHHWHHTRHAPLNRNFSPMFPWTDALFGTLYLPAHWPDAYGCDRAVPESFAGQLLEPLFPFATSNQAVGSATPEAIVSNDKG